MAKRPPKPEPLKPGVYAVYTGDHAATNLDKIIENKGPYVKSWFGHLCIEKFITKRDVEAVKEGRMQIVRRDEDGNWWRLMANDGIEAKWKRAEITQAKLTKVEKQ